jgi:hypothetical protein
VSVDRELCLGFCGLRAGVASDQRAVDLLAGFAAGRCDRRFFAGGRMPERDVAPSDGLELAETIGLLRDELLKANAAAADSDIHLLVESMTVELVARRRRGGLLRRAR